MSWDQAVVGVPAGVVALLLGFLTYKRSVKVDTMAAQTGALSEDRAGRAEVAAAQQRIIDNLQEDNATCRAALASCQIERNTIQRELNRMYRKYGENGNGVGASPPPLH